MKIEIDGEEHGIGSLWLSNNLNRETIHRGDIFTLVPVGSHFGLLHRDGLMYNSPLSENEMKHVLKRFLKPFPKEVVLK